MYAHLGGVLFLGGFMSTKIFKTTDEQIEILKSRGLLISNEDKAKKFLMRNNYYRISGYSLTLRSHDVFYPSTDFQNIIDIYEFDHKLRHILLKYIDIIENTVKSIYAHEFTRVHGPIGYRNSSYFTDFREYSRIFAKSENQKDRRHAHEAFLKHYLDELHEDVPFWAYVELFTISDISCLFAISEETLKSEVAKKMGLTNSNRAELLGKFMHSMTIIRNLCAHGSRVYNRLFEQKPSLNKKELKLLRVSLDGIKDNAHLFGFILIMKKLLKITDFTSMLDEIKTLNLIYPFVDMKYYGFCDDWENLL